MATIGSSTIGDSTIDEHTIPIKSVSSSDDTSICGFMVGLINVQVDVWQDIVRWSSMNRCKTLIMKIVVV